MRKISLFIAMSLDGYIADRKGGVDWLKGHSSEDEDIDTYSEFVKTVRAEKVPVIHVLRADDPDDSNAAVYAPLRSA